MKQKISVKTSLTLSDTQNLFSNVYITYAKEKNLAFLHLDFYNPGFRNLPKIVPSQISHGNDTNLKAILLY